MKSSRRIRRVFTSTSTCLYQHLFKRPMIVKHVSISGPVQGTTFTVRTLNGESNYACREKKHFQFHCETSTQPEKPVRPFDVMFAWTIGGISTKPETYLIFGQVSHGLFDWKKKRQRNERHRAAHSAQREYGLVRRDLFEPNAYDFKETYVESYTELLTSPPFFSKQGFPEDADNNDAALEDMLREAHRVHVHHSQREDLSVSQSSSVSERKGRPAESSGQDAQIKTLLDRQKERILAECQAIINRHEYQAEELQRRDQQFLHGQLLQQNLELREAHQKSLSEMEELRKFQSSTFDTIARRKFFGDQNTFLELFGRIQDLQNEINCMNDSKEFQEAESIRSGNSHVTSQPAFFPPFQNPGGMLSRSLGMPSRNDGPPSIWDTWFFGKRFANPAASSSAPFPQELNPWCSQKSEHTSPTCDE